MSGTPLFLITDAGLAAASIATPTGPYIHITSFEIGSGYGYTPQTTDTGLNGNLLYTGVPTSYEMIGNNTLNIICEIPPNAGPFDFGEVALFLDGGVMFAKAVFDSPQTKFSSLGTNVVSSYTLNCLLKLQQSTAIFQIDTINAPPAVVDIYQWSDVYPPGISANPDVPLYLVRELSWRGDSTLLQNTSDAAWSLTTSYFPYSPKGTNGTTFAVQNASTTWVEVLASTCHVQDLALANREVVLQTADGFFRSVNNIVTSGSNYRFNLNVTNDGTYNNSPLLTAPPVSSGIRLYRADQVGGSIYYSQIVDPPTPYVLPVATATVLGGVKKGANVTIAGDGTLSVAAPYVLPIASAGTLGGVKIGTGISEGGDGTINVVPYSLPVASAGTLGGVKIGTGISEAGDGTISLPIATSGALGGVKIGSGITEAGDGTISVPYTPPIAAAWSIVGSFTGTYTTTNSTSHVQFYSFQGGNWVGGSGDNRTNPYSLVVTVNGVGVASVADNDGDDHRIGQTFAMVPPGATVSCTSSPFSAPASGTFNVYSFTGLMV
jgi:hypothetical protein